MTMRIGNPYRIQTTDTTNLFDRKKYTEHKIFLLQEQVHIIMEQLQLLEPEYGDFNTEQQQDIQHIARLFSYVRDQLMYLKLSMKETEERGEV